jgi:uncharacterized protein
MKEDFHSIKWPLAIDRGLGSVSDEIDYPSHVEQMIKQLLLTNPGERVNRPSFGCGLRRMVFHPNMEPAATLLKVTILQALDTWLSTVIKVDDVTVTASSETLSVSLRYVLTARQERRYLNVTVQVGL